MAQDHESAMYEGQVYYWDQNHGKKRNLCRGEGGVKDKLT